MGTTFFKANFHQAHCDSFGYQPRQSNEVFFFRLKKKKTLFTVKETLN